mmetsp:Transcript_4546/g.5986  ORF Transcript_4546/g.5986 Transcript_4546/m.5986 type:complete len:225 (-) Transcript_4546:489-1163(-)
MCGGKTKEKNGRRRRRSLVDENVVAAEQVLERFVFQFSLNHTVDIIENSTSVSAAALSQEQDNHKKRQSSSEEDKAILSAAMRELERGMRDTLLSVISMDGCDVGGSKRRPGSTTFKLCLHMSSSSSNHHLSPQSEATGDTTTKSCMELENAIQEGTWFQPDDTSCTFEEPNYFLNNNKDEQEDNHTTTSQSIVSKTGLTRPLKNVNVSSCGMKVQLLMQVECH